MSENDDLTAFWHAFLAQLSTSEAGQEWAPLVEQWLQLQCNDRLDGDALWQTMENYLQRQSLSPLLMLVLEPVRSSMQGWMRRFPPPQSGENEAVLSARSDLLAAMIAHGKQYEPVLVAAADEMTQRLQQEQETITEFVVYHRLWTYCFEKHHQAALLSREFSDSFARLSQASCALLEQLAKEAEHGG